MSGSHNENFKKNLDGRQKTSFFKKHSGFMSTNPESLKTSQSPVDQQEPTFIQELAWKQRMQAEKKKNLIISSSILGGCALIFGIWFVIFLNDSADFEEKIAKEISIEENKENKKDFDYHMKRGLELIPHHVNSGITHFELAVELRSKDFDANIKLSQCYNARCQYEKRHCDLAYAQLQKLKKLFPREPFVKKMYEDALGKKMND